MRTFCSFVKMTNETLGFQWPQRGSTKGNYFALFFFKSKTHYYKREGLTVPKKEDTGRLRRESGVALHPVS